MDSATGYQEWALYANGFKEGHRSCVAFKWYIKDKQPYTTHIKDFQVTSYW